jgi:4-hydroxy-tetrahydrodipicolinate synthase
MTASGDVDHDGIRHNVEYLISAKVDGAGFGFSEPWYLTLQERMDAFETFIKAVDHRIPSYIHAVDYSVPETINLIRHVRGLGADAVMLWTPMEFAKTQQMVRDWFEYVASQVDIPILAYNTYHSAINFDMDTIATLADIENVCGLKDAVNDFGHTVAATELVGDRIVVSNPLEKHLAAMRMYLDMPILLGATSVFLMQSPNWQPIRDYVAAIDAGDHAGAWTQFHALDPLRDIWNSIYEPLWQQKGALHPIPLIKHWMDLIGMHGGAVRPPMHNLTDADRAGLRERLEGTGLFDKLRVVA